MNSSLTFSAVFALVSKNNNPASLAYASASAVSTALFDVGEDDDGDARSSLLPASAITMFSLAWRWSSLTHALALSSEDCVLVSLFVDERRGGGEADGLRDIIDHYSAVGVAIVHGCQGLVTLLASGIPGGRRDGLDDRSHGREGDEVLKKGHGLRVILTRSRT